MFFFGGGLGGLLFQHDYQSAREDERGGSRNARQPGSISSHSLSCVVWLIVCHGCSCFQYIMFEGGAEGGGGSFGR